MRRLNTRAPRTAGLLVLALGAVALLALSGVATAKDRHGDDHGRHHGRHHDHGHQLPMREAGTVSSFDATTGKLTIALTGGDSVTGLVTTDTQIKCEGVDDRLARRDHSSGEPGDDNGGESSGPEPSGGQGQPVEGAPAPVPAAPACTVASLTPGAVVGDAELRLEGGTAAFTEVELGIHS
jgi:hypothetical protein